MVFTRKAADGIERSASSCPRARCSSPPAPSPNITYEKEHPGTFQLDDRQKFFQGFRAVKGDDGTFTLEPDANGFFTSYNSDGRFVSYYGDNHPRYAGNVVKAMASAKDGYPHVVAAVRGRDRGARSGRAAGARSASGTRWSSGSTISCSRASSASSG